MFDLPFPNDLIYQATLDAGIIVGQTESRILVYENDTLTLHFIAPQTGEI